VRYKNICIVHLYRTLCRPINESWLKTFQVNEHTLCGHVVILIAAAVYSLYIYIYIYISMVLANSHSSNLTTIFTLKATVYRLIIYFIIANSLSYGGRRMFPVNRVTYVA